MNGDHVHGRRELKHGEVMDIAGVVLEFRLNVAEEDNAGPAAERCLTNSA